MALQTLEQIELAEKTLRHSPSALCLLFAIAEVFYGQE
jgi:hypothetical protein